jgi:CDP-paratose 2-epimerase
LDWQYVESPRIRDHIWWISNMRKFHQHFPEWSHQYHVKDILEQIVANNVTRRV